MVAHKKVTRNVVARYRMPGTVGTLGVSTVFILRGVP